LRFLRNISTLEGLVILVTSILIEKIKPKDGKFNEEARQNHERRPHGQA
jgi:hypothetical protein